VCLDIIPTYIVVCTLAQGLRIVFELVRVYNVIINAVVAERWVVVKSANYYIIIIMYMYITHNEYESREKK